MNYLKIIINNKKNNFLFLLLMSFQLASCASLDNRIGGILGAEKICYIKKEKYNGDAPEWYRNFKHDRDYYYIIKNHESSSQKDLAIQKNILISKMMLSNLVHKKFMSCEDQKQMVFHIRKSKTMKDISKFRSNNLIENLVSEANVEKEGVFENNKVFTSFIILSLPRK